MKSWSLTFTTQMLFRRSGSELFDTFVNIIHLRIFPLKNIYSWKMLRKLKWQIPGELLAARYNWCQGPAVKKHCHNVHTACEMFPCNRAVAFFVSVYHSSTFIPNVSKGHIILSAYGAVSFIQCVITNCTVECKGESILIIYAALFPPLWPP
jgi:hypothetical protein